MREIKFRAWDKKQKFMDIVDGYNLFIADGKLYEVTERGSWDKYMDRKNVTEDYELMQYTGLKDKNGKEIYEGDIVETHFDKTNQYEPYTEVGVVNITPYRTEIEDKKHGKYNNFYSHSEIIGNIYENAELLTNP